MSADSIIPAAFTKLEQWLKDAAGHPQITEPTAMALATATLQGAPSVRIILLKEWSARGATFFTNNESQKGEELRHNPQASLCFYWMPLGRQVRLSGPVTAVTAAESDAYFASRRRGSQIGAWASEQSRPLASREALLVRNEEYALRYAGAEVPRPPHWAGWRLAPQAIEFWQEGEYRLHHREIFRRDAAGQWRHELLNP